MFIAISKPYQDKFIIDKNGSTLVSKANPGVTIEIPEGAVEGEILITLEVHHLNETLLNDVYAKNDVFTSATFGAMVYINRCTRDTLHVKQPVILNIPLPPDIPNVPAENTELRIGKDEMGNGEWKDVTEEVSFSVEDGMVSITMKCFSGFWSTLRDKFQESRTLICQLWKMITEYRILGHQQLHIVLLQDNSYECILLCDLVDSSNRPIADIIKKGEKYQRYVRKCGTCYSSKVQLMNGDTIFNELSPETEKEFKLTSTINKHQYRPNEDNHWNVKVQQNASSVLPLTGEMIFFKSCEGGDDIKLSQLYFAIGENKTYVDGSNAAGIDPFRLMLKKVADELRSGEFATIKKLLTGKQITKQESENIACAFDLFNILEEKGLIKTEDTTLLERLLTEVGRVPLAEKVRNYKFN